MKFRLSTIVMINDLHPNLDQLTVGEVAVILAKHYVLEFNGETITDSNHNGFTYLALAVIGADCHVTKDENHPNLANILPAPRKPERTFEIQLRRPTLASIVRYAIADNESEVRDWYTDYFWDWEVESIAEIPDSPFGVDVFRIPASR